MDFSRSESAHQAVPIGPVALIIRQSSKDLIIETQRSESNSSAVSSETLTFKLDGTETVNNAKSDVPIKAKAHWDGPRLVTETEREINGSTITTMQVFRLGAGGSEITVDKTLTVQHGYQSAGAAKSTGVGKDVYTKSASPERFPNRL